METELNNNKKLSTGQETPAIAKVLLASVKAVIALFGSIPKHNRTLYFPKRFWERETCKRSVYSFSKEELDIAEKSQTKFIGNRNGVDCYLEG